MRHATVALVRVVDVLRLGEFGVMLVSLAVSAEIMLVGPLREVLTLN